MAGHAQKPRADGRRPEVERIVEALSTSVYVDGIRPLAPKVTGRRVVGSDAGHSGFVLLLDDGSWVASFMKDRSLGWSVGLGVIPISVKRAISSPRFLDLRAPLDLDVPYASESCDIAEQVRRAHGQEITGLAYGESCFNFCFPEGLELDTRVLSKSDGIGLRVFWEQW